jgi:hypothetical protein
MSIKRGAKFHTSEINFLFDNIENVMPIADTEWDTMASLHNEKSPHHARTAELLCCKFQEVVLMTAPTGDSKCAVHIRHAKLINRQLFQMIDSLTGGSDGSKSGEDESVLEDALEDPRDLVDCFEGVGQGKGLVGDGAEVLVREVQGVADDDGGGDDGGGGESGVGGESNGVEGNGGGENHVSNGGSCDGAMVGENNGCNGCIGGSGVH